MTCAEATRRTILCVDDNRHVADALRVKIGQERTLEWLGWLPDATDLVAKVVAESPTIVLLDLDMPGRDPFEALAELSDIGTGTRTLVFSGHVRKELIDRAIEAGAWGYVSKSEGEEALLDAIEKVLGGEFTLSPEVRAVLDG